MGMTAAPRSWPNFSAIQAWRSFIPDCASRRKRSVYKEKEIAPPPMFLGGIIPSEDMAELREIGIREVFPPGTPLEQVAGKVREIAGH
jgi:methylmalonyl-CoA mutase cobalamin-binding domain/chain